MAGKADLPCLDDKELSRLKTLPRRIIEWMRGDRKSPIDRGALEFNVDFAIVEVTWMAVADANLTPGQSLVPGGIVIAEQPASVRQQAIDLPMLVEGAEPAVKPTPTRQVVEVLVSLPQLIQQMAERQFGIGRAEWFIPFQGSRAGKPEQSAVVGKTVVAPA